MNVVFVMHNCCRDLEERRIYVHVFKHLRRQQAKLDKDPTKQVTAHLSFEESH